MSTNHLQSGHIWHNYICIYFRQNILYVYNPKTKI